MSSVSWVFDLIRVGLISIISLSCFAGPIVVGGGAGESEFSLVFARTNLVDLVGSCLKYECDLSRSEIRALNILTQKSQNPPEAIFQPSLPIPGQVFESHPELNQVWFSQNDLWLDQEKTVAYSIESATGLWMQVLGETENISPAIVDSLKRKTISFLSQKFENTVTNINDQNQLMATVWKQQPVNRFFLSDSTGQVIDLTEKAQATIQCGNLVAQSIHFFSGTWHVSDASRSSSQFILRMNVIWNCNGIYNRGELLAVGSASLSEDETFKIDQNSLNLMMGVR
jgi:hypothetical protein